MNYGYPVSDAQILMKLVKKDEAESSASDIIEFKPYNQLVINDRLQFRVEPPKKLETRAMYGISDEVFLLVIIGNRLQSDLTAEFRAILKSIFDLDKKVELLLIGNYPEYQTYFKEEIFCGRIHHIGYHTHLTEVLGIGDLFLNPPRSGGGTSALMALYCGVPVVTLPEGDVAGNVGADYTCRDVPDMIATIKRYLTDREFYETQKQTGLENMRKLTDPVRYLKDKFDTIIEAISILEDGMNEDREVIQ
jgi:glycosyltransferase involved in cell wall biosynthesis